MARSSTDLRTGQRRLLLAGVMLSVALHLVLLGSAWPPRVRWVAAPAARPLVVAWVKAAMPAAKLPVSALAESMPVGITTHLPAPARAQAVDVESPPPAPAQVAALPEVAASQPDSSAAAIPVDAAASAALAGIAFAPPRWGGFSGRWGRPAVASRQEDDDVFAQQEAQRQSRRLAAQQQQAMAELAWRATTPVAPPQAGW